jgi:hypothetical protein
MGKDLLGIVSECDFHRKHLESIREDTKYLSWKNRSNKPGLAGICGRLKDYMYSVRRCGGALPLIRVRGNAR